MGLPAAGKSTVAQTMVGQSYHRLNRDEAGGTLRDLVQELDRAIASGVSRVVLDNTYVSRKSRAEVVRVAAAHGMPVRCLWLTTDLESAQVNAATRIVTRYGRLPDEAELKKLAKRDVAAFPPSVLFRFQRELEPPDPPRDSLESTRSRSSGDPIRRSSIAPSSSGATTSCSAASPGVACR